MIFLDNNKQLNLGEKGYVIETLLSEEQVADLLHYFENIKAEHSYPFTLCSTSQELKKNVFELLRDKLQPALNSLLQNFRVTGANFYFKAHGSQVNTVPPPSGLDICG